MNRLKLSKHLWSILLIFAGATLSMNAIASVTVNMGDVGGSAIIAHKNDEGAVKGQFVNINISGGSAAGHGDMHAEVTCVKVSDDGKRAWIAGKVTHATNVPTFISPTGFIDPAHPEDLTFTPDGTGAGIIVLVEDNGNAGDRATGWRLISPFDYYTGTGSALSSRAYGYLAANAGRENQDLTYRILDLNIFKYVDFNIDETRLQEMAGQVRIQVK